MIAGLALTAALATGDAARLERSVDAAGVTLHIVCAGERQPRQPMVILEAGAGNTAATWRDVLVPVAQFARVCAYDRQNLGTSARVEAQPTGGGHAETLHALLQAAHEPPPYVIDIDLEDAEVVRVLARIHLWPLTREIAHASTQLDIRGDAADELIAATSVVHNVPLITRDRAILKSKIVPLAR